MPLSRAAGEGRGETGPVCPGPHLVRHSYIIKNLDTLIEQSP